MVTYDLTDIINPQPKQKEALDLLFDPRVKYLLYGGAMAGGKSYVLRWAAWSYLYYIYLQTGQMGVTAGLFSEDYPTLKDRQIARIKREFPKWLGELKDTKDEGFAFYMNKKYGAGRILLRNLDDPSKYMSSEFAGIFVEELTRNDEQVFEDLRNRLRWPGIEEVKFMGASNPGGIGHAWVKKLFVDRESEDPEQDRFFYVHANAYDNKFISEAYLKQLESLPEQKRKAYLEGSWDVFAGQYFSEFSRSKHVVPSFIPNKSKFYMFIGGLDWGRVAPFAFTLTGIQLKKHEGVSYYRAWTFDEVYGTDKTPREWGEEIVKRLHFHGLTLNDLQWIQADTQIFVKGLDMSKSIKDQFGDVDDRFRFKLKPASKDRIGGWENMHSWLSAAPDGMPYWLITENCKNGIRTLPALVHDEVHMEDVDTKGEDHWGDASRYQFKAIKWIDAKVGGVGKSRRELIKPAAIMTPEGKQISINTDAFSEAWDKLKRRPVGGVE